jgi:hypothetical protein
MGVKTVVVDDTTGTEYYGEVMRAGKADLGTNDRGIFDVSITLSGNHTGVTFGGYVLDEYDDDDRTRGATRYGMDFIMKTLWVFGVDRWSEIQGREVFTLWKNENPLGSMIQGVASLDGTRVFIPAVHAEQYAFSVATGRSER